MYHNKHQINIEEHQIFQNRKNMRLGSAKENPATETFFDCLIQNFEKIITLFLIVYFVFLIINLTTCKHSLITYYLFSHTSDQQNNNSEETTDKMITQNEGKFNSFQNVKENKDKLEENTKIDLQQVIQISQIPFQTQAEKNSQTLKKKMAKFNLKQNILKKQKKPQNVYQTERPLQNQINKQLDSKINSTMEQKKQQLLNEQFRTKILQKYNILLSNYQTQKISFQQKSVTIQRNEIISNYLENHFEQFQENLQLSLQNYQIKSSSSKLDKLQKQKISQKYQNKHYTEQNTFCIVVTTNDNTSDQQFKRTIISILNQYYKKIKIVISDRSKQTKYGQLVTQTLQNSYELEDIIMISKHPLSSRVEATYLALKQCKEDNIAILMDSNSQLLGRYILRLLDINYSQSQATVIYSDSFNMNTVTQTISKKTTSSYDESQMFMNLYRDIPTKFGNFFTFKYDLLQNFPTSMLINSDEQWFSHTSNEALILSILQLSCSHSTHINVPLVLSQQDEIETVQQKQAAKQQRKVFNRKNKLDFC